MIQIKGLNYWHNKYESRVLDNINLDIKPGITGLLGVNGAGKTTLLKILATAVAIKEGDYHYKGTSVKYNPDCVRQVLGYLPQNFTFYQKMTTVQVLKYLGSLKLVRGKELNSRIDFLLEVFNLSEVKYTPLEYLSGGMKQRVGLAQAFLNQPAIVLLDEPTQGLDVIEKRTLFTFLEELAAQSIIIFSSHYVEELEALCRDVIMLSKGSVKYQGPVEQLVGDYNVQAPYRRFATLKEAFFCLSGTNNV
jgi:ABC-2 type transport system ATP-binding protein